MKTFNVAIVGGGPGCLAIMDMIYKDRFRQLRMNLIGVADTNPSAPAIQRAKELNLFTTTEYHDLFSLDNVDLIIELTGNPRVSQAIQKEKPPGVQFMDHTVARLFWDFIQLEDEKLRAEKEAEKKIKEERDYTSKILNTLADSILVMDDNDIINDVNDTFLREFNTTRQEVIGKHCYEAIFGRQGHCAESFCPLLTEAGKAGYPRRKEYSLERKGSLAYYEVDYTPLHENGHARGWLISLHNVTDRKTLQLDLERSQKRYRDLFQNAGVGLMLFDSSGRILEANLAMAMMLEYPRAELESMNISDLALDHGRAILSKHLEDLKILGFTAVEIEFQKKGGETVPVEVNITWLEEESIFQVMARDITLKRKLEESRKAYSERLEKEVEQRTLQLKRSEAEARKLQKTAEGIIYGSPIPMFVLNKDHKIMYWNKACEKLTGFSSKETLGTDNHWKPFYPNKRPLLADLIIDGDIDRIYELYKDMNLRKSTMVEGAFEAEYFFPHLGPNGTHLYFNAAPIKDDQGQVQGAIVTYQDFTERVRMTEEIKRRQAFVQNLIENSIDGIIATDEKGRIVIFNRGATEILGYNAREVIGNKTYREILTPQTASRIRSAFYGDQFGPPGKIINMETEFLHHSGDLIPVRLSGTLLYQKKKEVGSVVFIQDLREILRLQREKEQAERMAAIGRTVAGLAHYIKNIVTGLKGGAYVINSAVNKKDLGLVQKGWQMVERNIEQISNIVLDMLIYSRERKPQYQLVDPNSIVEEVVELMQERARLSAVDIELELDCSIGVVAMDKTAIHRCLLNLIGNAIDACTLEGLTQGRGKVIIRTDRPEGWGVRFQVIDNGTGMDEETQSKLFTDFFTTKGYNGTGLGLPVTQKIVKEHNGLLNFESTKGKGTTFTLLLPERNLDEKEPSSSKSPITSHSQDSY
ncbi:MAG TPA: PAS domain S-box protein [Desulfobacterales bacterium]|nr:PAS domain S-box protein [Desulfobacterales bacterium]